MAIDYAPYGIRVNAVVPGATETTLMWSNVAAADIPKMRGRISKEIPLGRLARPEDPARAVAWLLSDESSYVTGSHLVCDGGTLAKASITCNLVDEVLGCSMKITKIQCGGLRGATPEGGWSNEIKQDDCIHTLIAVYTDEGVTGWGSVFTNDGLVAAALKVLEPLFIGENPLEPERVSEKLHAHTFWLGRGGSLTHAISGIDIAMWDILGKAVGSAGG